MNEPASQPRIYLDTNIFIQAFEGVPEEVGHVRTLFEELQAHPKAAVTNELTLGELLAETKGGKPLHLKRRFYLNLIVWGRLIDLRPTTRSIWLETAELHKYTGFKLPEAVQVVTAIQAYCSYFMSDDRRIRNLPDGTGWVPPTREGVATIGNLRV